MTMTDDTEKPEHKHRDSEDFITLAPYISKISKGYLQKNKIYSLCVRASISKCFEFNMNVRRENQSENAFFAMSSLRGICEDLIVLRYMKNIPAIDRQDLLVALMHNETNTRIKLQDQFFSALRPQQIILRRKNIEKSIVDSELQAQAIWHRHGWPNLKKGAMPQIRQIAEKQGLPLLSVLYDYLYRLTSSGVHFNVQSLLRSGWGIGPKQMKFSTVNFNKYFISYCTTYGAFMFCLYFEFFNSILRPNLEASNAVSEIRKKLLFTPRWPEMVTFEEMNLKPPEPNTLNIVLSSLQAVARKKLVTSGLTKTEKDLAKLVLEALSTASSK